MNTYKNILFVCLLLWLVMACDSKEKEELTPEETEAQEILMQESADIETENLIEATILFVVGEGGKMAHGTNFMLECAKISHDKTNKVVTFGFGTVNVTCEDGKKRRGSIEVKYTSIVPTEGAIFTVTSQEYYLNDNRLEMQYTYTQNGVNVQGNRFHTMASTVNITYKDALKASRKANYTYTIVNPNSNTSAIEIEGSASGISRKGKSYTANITKTLIKRPSCFVNHYFYAVSGERMITIQNNATNTIFLVAYGNGECDNKIQITHNGESRNIEMK